MQDIGVYEMLENKVMIRKKTRLTRHIHFHAHIEILYMVSGNATAIVDQKEYAFTAGDFLVVFPFQSHSLYSAEDAESHFMQFPQTLLPEFHAIFDDFKPLNPVIKNDFPETQYICGIFEMIFHDYQNIFYLYEEIDTALFRSYLYLLVHKLLKCTRLKSAEHTNLHTIKSILDYCSKNYMYPLHLQDVADDLYLSRKYVSNIFSDKLHISFLEYINTLRICAACSLLRNTKDSISDIAMSVGFESIRTFHRQFEKITGRTPRSYRKTPLPAMHV